MAWRFLRDTRAESSVIGEAMAVLVVIGVAGGVAYVTLDSEPPPEVFVANVQAWIECGLGGWGSGDERFVIRHAGGEDIPRLGTRIQLIQNGVVTSFPQTGPGQAPDLDGDGVPEDQDTIIAALAGWTGTGTIPGLPTAPNAEQMEAFIATGLWGDFVDDERMSLANGERWTAQLTFMLGDTIDYRIRSAPGARVDVLHTEAAVADQRCGVINVCGIKQAAALGSPFRMDSIGHFGETTPSGLVNVPAGDHRLMMVAVAEEGAVLGQMTGLTFDGQSLTKLIEKSGGPPGLGRSVQLWYLKDPPVGTSELSATLSGIAAPWSASVMLFKDVNTESPFGAVGGRNGDATDVSLTLTTKKAASLVVGAVAHTHLDATLGPIAGTIEQFDVSATSFQFAGGHFATGNIGSYTWGFTATGVPATPSAREWSLVAAEIKGAVLDPGALCIPVVTKEQTPCLPTPGPHLMSSPISLKSSQATPGLQTQIPISVADGNGRLLIVTVHDRGTGVAPAAMTLGSDGLTKIGRAEILDGLNVEAGAEAWFLKSPTPGAGMLTVMWPSVLWNDWVITISSYVDVLASNPIGNVQPASGTSYNMQKSVTTTAGSLLMAAATHEGSAAGLYPLGTTVERVEESAGLTAGVGEIYAGAGPQSIGFLATDAAEAAVNRQWAMLAFEVRATTSGCDVTAEGHVDPLHTVDFSSYAAGQVMTGALSDKEGAVGIHGESERAVHAGLETAIIFDSSHPTGGDYDLGTPNQGFGGPGIGAGGAPGQPFENAISQGKILIIAEDLIDVTGGVVPCPNTDLDGDGDDDLNDFLLVDGGIQLVDDAPVEMYVIGTEITYGAGGPDIPVWAWYSSDAGVSWVDPFGGPVSAGDVYDLGSVASGSLLATRGHAEGHGFVGGYWNSVEHPNRVWVLVDGDPIPDVPGFDGQPPISAMLADFTHNGTVDIASNEAIALFELGSSTSGPAADFQDLVVLYRVSPLPDQDPPGDDPPDDDPSSCTGTGPVLPPGNAAKAIWDHSCDSTEWHFVITGVASIPAPATIAVGWASGTVQHVVLDGVTGNVAHYRTTSNLGEPVVGATMQILAGWSGQFNLSHGPCYDEVDVDAGTEGPAPDGLVDDPDDEDLGGTFTFDFTAVQSTVRMMQLRFIDTEEIAPEAYVELLGPGGELVAQLSGQNIGDNGAQTLSLGATPGVATMVVHLSGSGAIDNIVFSTV